MIYEFVSHAGLNATETFQLRLPWFSVQFDGHAHLDVISETVEANIMLESTYTVRKESGPE